MPSQQEDGSKTASEIQAELNQALIGMLLEELRYRFQCRIDQWSRENWLSSMFNTSPFQDSLTQFDLAYPKIAAGAEILLIQAQANAIVDVAKKLSNPPGANSFSKSVKAIFQTKKILPIPAEENAEKIDDPVVEQCLQHTAIQRAKVDKIELMAVDLGLKNIPGYQDIQDVEDKSATEKLYLKAKYPHLLRASSDSLAVTTAVASREGARESPVGLEDSFKNLAKTIKGQIYSLYGGGANQAISTAQILTQVKTQSPSFLGIFESSEQKTVKVILKEIDKNSSDKIDMVAVERRLKRLEGLIAERTQTKSLGPQVVPASDSAVTIDGIRATFGEMRFSSKITSRSIKVDASGQVLDNRVRELEQYKKALTAAVELGAINSANLPADEAYLQALIYFIFQCNIKEKIPDDVAVFSPFSWTENDGLKIDAASGKYADLLTLFNKNLLDQTNPAFYFAVLMTSMALICSENEGERTALKLLLNAIFVGGEEYLAHSRLIPDEKTMPIYFWLKSYLPSELTVSTENAAVIKVKEALESKGMFIAASRASQASSQIASSQIVIKTQVVSNTDRAGLAEYASRISQMVVGNSSSFSEKLAGTQVEEKFSEYSDQGVSGEVMLLYALVLWFIQEAKAEGDYSDSKFMKELVSFHAELEKILKVDRGQEVSGKSLILNWKILADAATAGTSYFDNTGQAAVRFMERIDLLFPNGSVIFPGGKVSGVVMSQKTHSAYPNANPYTLRAYELCQSFQKGDLSNIPSNVLRQYEQMLRALSFAVTSEQKEFPKLINFMPKLPKSVPEELQSLKTILDKVRKVAASARAAYVPPVARAVVHVVESGGARDGVVTEAAVAAASPSVKGGTASQSVFRAHSPAHFASPSPSSHSWDITSIQAMAMPMIEDLAKSILGLKDQFIYSLEDQSCVEDSIQEVNDEVAERFLKTFEHKPAADRRIELAIWYGLEWCKKKITNEYILRNIRDAQSAIEGSRIGVSTSFNRFDISERLDEKTKELLIELNDAIERITTPGALAHTHK